MIRELHDDKGAVCAEILAALPNWFGLPESNAAYVRDVERMPMFVAEDAERIQGFLALNQHSPYAVEIHVLAVRPEHHRGGLGRALVSEAEAYTRSCGARFLTVKTRSPSAPDEGYLKTYAFYLGVGFLPIEEFPLLWNPENPALMLMKVV
jgi:GNAT superfamily N-acetyltransferase